MHWIDAVTVIVSLVGVTVLGVAFSKRGGKDTGEFILGGRRLPWWLAGTSASAASFNADSPLHQSRKIRQTGLAGAWFYWTQMLSSLVSVVIFGRMWRRAGIFTVVEFYNVRYSGHAKDIARIWNALNWSVVMGSGLVATGLLGLTKVSRVLLDLPGETVWLGVTVNPSFLIAISILFLAVTYATASGVWGVVWTDLVEFAIAMFCSYLLLFIVFGEIGWAEGLKARIAETRDVRSTLSVLPPGGLLLIFWVFISPLNGLAGYPTDVQRYMSVKDEREVVMTGIWRIVTTLILRGWPWYLCGLISIFLISDSFLLERFGALSDGGPDLEMAYPSLIIEYMPVGFRGLMIAGFLSAFMSSVDTITHHNAAVFVNDIYRPYLRKDRSERHYVLATRIAMVVSAGLGIYVAAQADEIMDLLVFFGVVKSCTGVLDWARWIWWRVNIKADLVTQVAAFPITVCFMFPEWVFGEGFSPAGWLAVQLGFDSWDGRYAMMISLTIFTSTALWMAISLLTRPDPEETLIAFYKRARPYGFWGPIARKCPDAEPPQRFLSDLGLVAVAAGLCFGLLFAVGALFLAQWKVFAGASALTVISGILFARAMRRPAAPPIVPDA